MTIEFLKPKIHRATVTEVNLTYIMDFEETKKFKPRIIFPDKNNFLK